MVIACSSCGQKNRVAVTNLSATAKCGKCQHALTPVGLPIDADTATFDEIVSQSPMPVLVDFWAGWCGPCRLAAPEVKRTAHEMAGRALVVKVDTEAHPDIAQRYRVSGIPNFVVLKHGKVVRQQAGLVDAAQMMRWLAEA